MGRNLLIGLGILVACLTLMIVAVLGGLITETDGPAPPASEVRLQWLEEAACGDWLDLDPRERLTLTLDLIHEAPDAGDGLVRPRLGEARVTAACRGRGDDPLLEVIDEADWRAAPSG